VKSLQAIVYSIVLVIWNPAYILGWEDEFSAGGFSRGNFPFKIAPYFQLKKICFTLFNCIQQLETFTVKLYDILNLMV